MPAPIAAASPASKPVLGNVREEAAVEAAVVLAAAVVVEPVLDAVLEVGEDEDSGVVELPLELFAVGVGAGVCELPVDVCEPLWLPASGSVYWLSPAEGPPAIADAGIDSTTAASTTSQVSVTRQERTPRVLQQSGRLTPATRRGSGRRGSPPASPGRSEAEFGKPLFCRIYCNTRWRAGDPDGAC